MQIQSTANVAVNGAKIVIYGQPKIGKTTLCATAPSPLILSFEKGLLSLRRHNLPYIEINSIAELANILVWLRTDAKSKQFQTICFDSISDCAETVLSEEKRSTRDGRKAYGNTNDRIMDIFRDYRDLPRNVYFTAKEEPKQAGEVTRPWMPDRFLTTQLPYMFDTIVRMMPLRLNDGSSIRALRCQGDFETYAGDRSGNLVEWEEPNLSKLFAKITKG